MPTNLSRRVARIEQGTGARGRTMHMIELPHGVDRGEALKALGIDECDEDLVVFLIDPTEGEASFGKTPRLLSSKAMGT